VRFTRRTLGGSKNTAVSDRGPIPGFWKSCDGCRTPTERRGPALLFPAPQAMCGKGLIKQWAVSNPDPAPRFLE